MFFFSLSRFILALRLPLFKLALAFFGFKEGTNVGHHIVNDRLQNVFRHVAFCTAVAEGVTEALKRADQLGWVQKMNSIRNRAEEIVLNEIIYR